MDRTDGRYALPYFFAERVASRSVSQSMIHNSSQPPRLAFRLVIMFIMAVCVAAALYIGLLLTGGAQSQPTITAAPLPPGVELYPPDARYVLDPVVGHRPRSDCVTEFDMLAIDGTMPHHCRRRTNDLGYVRADDLERKMQASPRILLLGDSHLEGVVSSDVHAATLLEASLRRGSYPEALVLNAGCAYYSLYHYVLRLRSLGPAVRPDVIVIVVFAGNDFLEMEDVSRPHLNDQGVESSASASPPAEATSGRRDWLGLNDDAYFWQGLNQAVFYHQHPERRPVLRTRVTRCVELLKDEATKLGAHLEIVLLPPFDLVFPADVRELGARPAELVDGGVQQSIYDEFRKLLGSQGIPSIDLLPVFASDGRRTLYANDLHIYLQAHAILSERLLPRLRSVLEKRPR